MAGVLQINKKGNNAMMNHLNEIAKIKNDFLELSDEIGQPRAMAEFIINTAHVTDRLADNADVHQNAINSILKSLENIATLVKDNLDEMQTFDARLDALEDSFMQRVCPND
jgi:division protein CdvB (Snf7/Vps24/ESCRT-III family)